MFEEYKISVQPFDEDEYHYEVSITDVSYEISYCEVGRETQTLSFGSADEMEAVANAMLKLVKMVKQ